MSVMHQPLCEKLKATREGRGLSLADVAHLTRIPIPRLCQLEEGNYAAFGNMAYARGFIRIYSQFLGVDAEAFISGLPEPVLGGAADYRHLPTLLPAALIIGTFVFMIWRSEEARGVAVEAVELVFTFFTTPFILETTVAIGGLILVLYVNQRRLEKEQDEWVEMEGPARPAPVENPPRVD